MSMMIMGMTKAMKMAIAISTAMIVMVKGTNISSQETEKEMSS